MAPSRWMNRPGTWDAARGLTTIWRSNSGFSTSEPHRGADRIGRSSAGCRHAERVWNSVRLRAHRGLSSGHGNSVIEDLPPICGYAFPHPSAAVRDLRSTAVPLSCLGHRGQRDDLQRAIQHLWKPLPVSKPRSWSSSRFRRQSGQRDVPPIAFVGQLRAAGVFEDGSRSRLRTASALAYDDAAERVLVEVVSGNYFASIGRAVHRGPAIHARGTEWGAGRRKQSSLTVSGSGGSARPRRHWPHDPAQHLSIPIAVRLATGFPRTRARPDIRRPHPDSADGRELAKSPGSVPGPIGGWYTSHASSTRSSLAQAEASADGHSRSSCALQRSQRVQGPRLQHVTLVAVGKGDSGVLRQLHTPRYVLFVLVASRAC